MRTWVVTALLSAVLCLASSQSDKEIIRSVLKTWKHNEGIKYMDSSIGAPREKRFIEDDLDFETISVDHRRSKRAASPISSACTRPGYTGEYCDYPICGVRQELHSHDDDGDEVTIDAANLANCTEKYIVVVDESLYDIKFEIESEGPVNPTFYIQAADGTIVFPDTVAHSGTGYVGTFFRLPPGIYLVGPSADLQDNFCIFTMTAKTSLHVHGGFTIGDENERSDFPLQKYTYFDAESSIVLHLTSDQFPTMINVIGFTGSHNHIIRYSPVITRYNCSFPYIFERYTCRRNAPNDRGYNFLQVEGTTFQGYKFRRILSYQCLPQPVTTTTPAPTTPTQAPLTSCKNNGVFIKNPDGSAYCYCLGLFAGVDCGTRLCANGGYLASPNADRCTCKNGFSGFNCENVICTDNADISFDADSPTFTLVIRSRVELMDVINQVVNATNNMLNLMSFDPGYMNNFIIVMFDNGKLILSNKYQTWTDALVDLTTFLPNSPSDGGCSDVTFSAIASALSHYPNSKSPIYVLTDANPADSSEKETVFHLESYWRAPIYFLYVTPPPNDQCNTSPDSAGYRDYVDIAARTSGDVFYFSNRSIVYNFMYNHMLNTLYHSQLVLSKDLQQCGNQNLYQTVAVDSDVDNLVVVATGAGAQLHVTNPLGGIQDFKLQYSDGNNFVWSQTGLITGQYFFNLLTTDGTAACSFKVYHKKYNNAISFSPNYDLFWGFTSEMTRDAVFASPIFNFEMAPVFHLTNYPEFVTMDRVHATLQIYSSRNGVQSEVYASSGLFRDACSMHFYFDPFTCRIPDETLYFNFFARDRNGFTIQRAGTYYCSIVNPTPPPDHGCQNGGVMNPSNTTCFCTPQFTGTYCQNIVCFNGGTAHGDHCHCPPGYAGDSCEFPKCTDPGTKPPGNRHGSDMVFVVETTANNFASIIMLNSKFQEIVRDVQMQGRGWIDRFVLVGFNSTWGGVITTALAYDVSNVTIALNNLATSGIPTDKGCNVKLWQALDSAIFQGNLAPGAYVEIFQSSPEDDTDAEALGLLYELSRAGNIVFYGFLAVTPLQKPNGFFCNATFEDYYTLFGITAGSTGNTYLVQPAEIPNLVRSIPLQYLNSIVFFNGDIDCTSGITTYFPVDAYTQTLMFYTYGFGSTLTIYDGTGQQRDQVQLASDSYSGVSISELRKPCEDGWDPIDQYCIKFVNGLDSLPMPDAKKFCASAGGFLVDDLDDHKNSFLYSKSYSNQFWIGLYNIGTKYVWDRGTFANATTLAQDNTFWATGSTPPLDDTKQCVFFDGQSSDSSKVWTLDSCSTPRPFVCQKHRYDQDFQPSKIGDDDLPAGLWYAVFSTNPTNAANPKSCSIEVRAQSAIQLNVGFVTSVGDDRPANDPIQDSTENRLISYAVNVATDNVVPRLTDAIILDVQNGTVYDALKYNERVGCQYPFASQTFSCPAATEVIALHIGEDDLGNTFQRISYAYCSKATITCGRGVRSNGRCYCEDYWTGSKCTVPICVNGGTRNADNTKCSCPDGYTGENCQFELCQPKIGDKTLSIDGKTLIIAVEATVQNNATIDMLINNLGDIVSNAISQSSGWFYNYALVTFDSNGVKFQSYTFTSIKAVITSLISQQNAITDQGTCNLPIYSVLQSIASNSAQITYPNSELLFFTTAGPSDGGDLGDTYYYFTNTEAHLHFIYSQASSCPSYNSVTDIANITYLAYTTSGNILVTTPTKITDLLSGYLTTLYGASIINHPTGHTGFQCSSGDPWYIEVDINTKYIYVSSTTEYGSISVRDSLSRIHTPDILYNYNDQKLYRISVDQISGIWSIALTSPGLCFVNIYATGGAKVYLKFAVTTASDPIAAHIDGYLTNPSPGVMNVADVELAGGFKSGFLTYIDIYDPRTIKLLLRSELYPRGNCSYTYYSDPFVCDIDVVAVFISGIDAYHQKFRRQELVFCKGVPTTFAPPATLSVGPNTVTVPVGPTVVTAPGGPASSTQGGPTVATVPSASSTPAGPPPLNQLKFDVVFLVDGSSSAQTSFKNFTSFIKTMMVSYDLTGNTHVGIFLVTGDNAIPAVASLNAITSQSTLITSLDTMQFYTDFSTSGQLLNLYLNLASSADYTAPSAGYRASLNNHVIIYLTTNTNFDVDPNATAQTIRASKKYGIITVGFGAAADNSKLQAVSGGNSCSYTATDFTSLNQLIPSINQQISMASANGGTYC